MIKCIFVRLLKFIALIVPIVLSVWFIQTNLFYYDDFNTRRIRQFYHEEPNTLDVVFMGASEVFSGFSPVHAYSYGEFTSYLYSAEGVPGSLYLPTLKEILSCQSPQVIIVEVNGFLQEDDYHSQASRLRVFLENTPFSRNKLQTAFEHNYINPISYLIPFFKYHGEWPTAFSEARVRYERRAIWDKRNTLKGVQTSTRLEEVFPIATELVDNDAELPLSPESQKYLIEFLDYCREVGQEVILIRFPHKLDSDEDMNRFMRSNRIAQIAQEYGYPFLHGDRLAEEIGLEFDADYCDAEHLGYTGQIKMTEYLSDWLIYDYGLIPRKQTEENALHWNSCIPYIEALNDRAASSLENGMPVLLYETPELMEKLEEQILSWYAGDSQSAL